MLNEPPDLVTAPVPHLLHRWEQWDKFCPAPRCCCPASSSIPHLLSLPTPALTGTLAQLLCTSRVSAVSCRGGKDVPYPSIFNSGSVLTNRVVPSFSCLPWQERFLDLAPGPITPTLLRSFSTGCQSRWELAPLEAFPCISALPSRPNTGSGREVLPILTSPKRPNCLPRGSPAAGQQLHWKNGPKYFILLMNIFCYSGCFFSLTKKKKIN